MHTIKLKISDKVYDKFLLLLSKFGKEEVEIVDADDYAKNKTYLEKELDEIREGNASFLSLEEFEEKLDNSIRSNEDKA